MGMKKDDITRFFVIIPYEQTATPRKKNFTSGISALLILSGSLHNVQNLMKQ